MCIPHLITSTHPVLYYAILHKTLCYYDTILIELYYITLYYAILCYTIFLSTCFIKETEAEKQNMIFIYFFIIAVLGGTLWHLKKILQYIIVEFTLMSFSFIPLPHFWNIFNRSHFSIFIHECTVFTPYSRSYTLSL
jgi:hypothetical protein